MQIDDIKKFDGFGLVASGPLAVFRWATRPTLEHVQTAGQFLTRIGRAHERFLLLVVVAPGAPAPDGPTRDQMSAELKRMDKHFMAACTVIEGEGFAAASLRAVVTGLNLLVRPKYPMKIVGTVADGAEFLSKSSDGTVSAAQIREAVQQLQT